MLSEWLNMNQGPEKEDRSGDCSVDLPLSPFGIMRATRGSRAGVSRKLHLIIQTSPMSFVSPSISLQSTRNGE